MYEDQTENVIRTRMLNNSPSALSKAEGDSVWDSQSPVAIELAQGYIAIDKFIELAFNPSGTYLDLRVADRGLSRKAATKATGVVTVSGAENSVIPAGTDFATPLGIYFLTNTAATISAAGTVDIAITAEEAGAFGNVAAHAISVIPRGLTGVLSVDNTSATTGGTDIESDADLLARYKYAIQNPATSGNAAQYRQWAMEIDGVGDARVVPLWNGAGTVKVLLLDEANIPASATIIDAVATHIEAERPIGATVTVVAATGLSIDVTATLTLASGYTLAGVKTAIDAAIVAYLAGIAFKQSYVSYSSIAGIILDTPGVLEFTGLTVNTGTANISVGNTQVAIIGTTTFS